MTHVLSSFKLYIFYCLSLNIWLQVIQQEFSAGVGNFLDPRYIPYFFGKGRLHYFYLPTKLENLSLECGASSVGATPNNLIILINWFLNYFCRRWNYTEMTHP